MNAPKPAPSMVAKQNLREQLLRDLPGLDEAAANELLIQARISTAPRVARAVDAYLSEHPAGLLTPNATCPRGLVRLAHLLADRGHPVIPPGCAHCSRRLQLTGSGPDGLLCRTCFELTRQPKLCITCGQPGVITARFGEEQLCRQCYRKDPRSHQKCGKCGRVRPVDHRGKDGEPLCQTCAPRPLHTCIDCGRRRPAQKLTPEGAVCSACYAKHQQQRPCGRCGKLAPIIARATGEQPDLCPKCWRNAYAKRRRATQPRKARPPARVRPERPPKLPRFATCSLCDQPRDVQINWPIGPVCGTCYSKTTGTPGICASCAELRVLIAKDHHGQLVCGPCAGSAIDYRCDQCGNGGRVAGGRCYRCCIDVRLHELLATPAGLIPEQLAPLVNALLAAEKPRSVWVWLNRSHAPQLLAELVAQPGPLTHKKLDALPPTRAVHFIRRILIDTAVLPDRMDYLHRIEPWLDDLLQSRPAPG